MSIPGCRSPPPLMDRAGPCPGTRRGAVAIDHEGGDPQSVIDHAFGAKNDRHIRSLRGRGDVLPRPLEEGLIGRRNPLPCQPVSGHVALRKADDVGSLGSSVNDRLRRQPDGFFRCCRKLEIGERDANRFHVPTAGLCAYCGYSLRPLCSANQFSLTLPTSSCGDEGDERAKIRRRNSAATRTDPVVSPNHHMFDWPGGNSDYDTHIAGD